MVGDNEKREKKKKQTDGINRAGESCKGGNLAKRIGRS